MDGAGAVVVVGAVRSPVGKRGGGLSTVHAADLFGLVRSVQHQTFGRYSGHVILDDGARLEVRDLLGFAEEVANRW